MTTRAAKTVYLEDALWKRLRVRAVQEGSSASKIIERLVAEYLGRRAK